MLEYEDLNGMPAAINADKVVRLSKEPMTGLEQTLIHLSNGEIIRTKDSILVLSARMEIET